MRIYYAYAKNSAGTAGPVLSTENNGTTKPYTILEARAGVNDQDTREQLQFALQKQTTENSDGSLITLLKHAAGDSAAGFQAWGAGTGTVTADAFYDNESQDVANSYLYRPKTFPDLIWMLPGTGGFTLRLILAPTGTPEVWAWFKIGEIG